MGRKLLAFDVGNSRLKVALFDDGEMVFRESLQLVVDEQVLIQELTTRLGQTDIPDCCLIASVVGGADEAICRAVDSVWGLSSVVVDTQMDLGIEIAVPRPDRVGIDRLLEASEAFHIVRDCVVVAAFGSAITVDLVTDDGVFRGGAILPGLRMGLRSLHEEASLLPNVALEPPPSALGIDTTACIQSGVIYGAAGAVDRLCGEFARSFSLVLTGGDADLMAPFIQTPCQIEPDLVLRGLASYDQRLLSENKKKSR